MYWSVSVASVANLSFTRMSFHELISFKFFFLVRNHSWHFEKKTRLLPHFRLWVLLTMIVVVGGGGGMEHVTGMMSSSSRSGMLGRRMVAKGEHVEGRGSCRVQHGVTLSYNHFGEQISLNVATILEQVHGITTLIYSVLIEWL